MFKAVFYKSFSTFSKLRKEKEIIEMEYFPYNMILYKEEYIVKWDDSMERVIEIEDPNIIPSGYLLVRVNNVQNAISYMNAKEIKYTKFYDKFKIFIVYIPVFREIDDFEQEIGSLPFVERSNKDIIFKSEPVYEFTYDHPYHWYLQRINSSEAWELMEYYPSGEPQSYTERKLPTNNWVEVAMFDTIVATNHPELQGKISEYSINCVSATNDLVSPDAYSITGEIIDTCGEEELNEDYIYHGTGVCGLIAAKNSNNDMMLSAGNDKVKCQILALTAVINVDGDCYSTGTSSNFVQLLSGFDAAFNNPRCVAISASYSLGGSINTYSCVWPILGDIIEFVATQGRNGKGIPFFAGSSNLGDPEVMTPGCYNYCYSVGASNQLDLKAGFSNYGEDLFICAPGENIMSLSVPGPYGASLPSPFKGWSLNNPIIQSSHQDQYQTYQSLLIANGTSSSTPIVATVAATLIYRNPSLTRQQVIDILAETAYKPTHPGETGYTYENGRCLLLGYGIVDHEAAMQRAIEYLTDPLQESPYLLDLTINIEIIDIPEQVNWGSIIQIETETTTTEDTLIYAGLIVIDFYISDTEEFSPTAQLIGSFVYSGLTEVMVHNSFVQLPCDDQYPINNLIIFAKVQAFDNYYNPLTFNTISDFDSVPIILENTCAGPEDFSVKITFMGVRNLYNGISPELIGGHGYQVKVENLGTVIIKKLWLRMSVSENVLTEDDIPNDTGSLETPGSGKPGGIIEGENGVINLNGVYVIVSDATETFYNGLGTQVINEYLNLPPGETMIVQWSFDIDPSVITVLLPEYINIVAETALCTGGIYYNYESFYTQIDMTEDTVSSKFISSWPS
jgi:hypothetical protein